MALLMVLRVLVVLVVRLWSVVLVLSLLWWC